MTSAAPVRLTIAQVLQAHPAAARVLLERRMACTGCPFAPFETVEDAARAYGADPIALAAALGLADAAPGAGEHER